MDHVHTKQQAVIEKLKQKRASSLATVKEVPSSTANASESQEPSSGAMINIKKIEVPKAPTPTQPKVKAATAIVEANKPEKNDK